MKTDTKNPFMVRKVAMSEIPQYNRRDRTSQDQFRELAVSLEPGDAVLLVNTIPPNHYSAKLAYLKKTTKNFKSHVVISRGNETYLVHKDGKSETSDN